MPQENEEEKEKEVTWERLCPCGQMVKLIVVGAIPLQRPCITVECRKCGTKFIT